VTGDRRAVRTTPSFFEDVDRQLGSERGPNGEPSVNDFQVFELLRVVEVFATRWNDLPPLIPGRSDYRILIASGMLIARLAVVGQLAADGAIELIELDIDEQAGST